MRAFRWPDVLLTCMYVPLSVLLFMFCYRSYEAFMVVFEIRTLEDTCRDPTSVLLRLDELYDRVDDMDRETQENNIYAAFAVVSACVAFLVGYLVDEAEVDDENVMLFYASEESWI